MIGDSKQARQLQVEWNSELERFVHFFWEGGGGREDGRSSLGGIIFLVEVIRFAY